MRFLTFLAVATAGSLVARPGAAGAQTLQAGDTLEARVWLDRGDEPVLRRGEHVRLYYRTSADAYAAIFRIDTDGVISLIFPQHPDADDLVPGGRDYRLLFPQTPVWVVEEDPGLGYFFMVASTEPLDFSSFPFDPERGWDLSVVGETVYEDPYVAIDDYVARVVPDWEVVPYALDFITYSVGDQYTYPRFLCYDCHASRSYTSWNPYTFICPSYRVVIWDDPYFYPAYRYSGTTLAVVRRARSLPRYGVTGRTLGAGLRPIVRTRAAPPRRVVEYKEPAGATATPTERTRRRTAVPRPQDASPASATRPTLQPRRARPSTRLPVRTPPAPATRPAPDRQTRTVAPPARTTPGARIVRPGRAPTRPSGGTSTRGQTRPQTRPQTTPDRTPARPSARTGARAAPTRPTPRSTSRPRTPSRPRATTRPPANRPAARQPARSRPSARPPARARPSTPSTGRPTARAPASRPTVRARPSPARGRGR